MQHQAVSLFMVSLSIYFGLSAPFINAGSDEIPVWIEGEAPSPYYPHIPALTESSGAFLQPSKPTNNDIPVWVEPEFNVHGHPYQGQPMKTQYHEEPYFNHVQPMKTQYHSAEEPYFNHVQPMKTQYHSVEEPYFNHVQPEPMKTQYHSVEESNFNHVQPAPNQVEPKKNMLNWAKQKMNWAKKKHPDSESELPGQTFAGCPQEGNCALENPQHSLNAIPSLSKLRDTYSIGKVNAIQKYTGLSFINLNRHLRDNQPLDSYLQVLYDKLLSALLKHRSTKEVTLFRGVRTTEQEMMEAFAANKGLERAFTSTSKSIIVAKDFTYGTCCLLHVKVPANTPMLSIQSVSNFEDEKEVLLPPGRFAVVKEQVVNGLKHFTVLFQYDKAALVRPPVA